MTKCKNPEQILLMVAVIDHILHFVKSGRILFSMQAPMLHSATETNPRFEILYASIVAVTDNLSDQKSKVFFSPIFVSCLPVTVQDGIWICMDTDTHSQSSILNSYICFMATIKEVQTLFLWPYSGE